MQSKTIKEVMVQSHHRLVNELPRPKCLPTDHKTVLKLLLIESSHGSNMTFHYNRDKIMTSLLLDYGNHREA